MGVSQILYVFGQIAEEENVGFANLPGDFDLASSVSNAAFGR